MTGGVPGTGGAHGSPDVTGPERATPLRVAAAVVWRRDQVLLTQRPPGGTHGLFWEFPGGKIEPGESPEEALVREIQEELGVRATPIETLGTYRHAYPRGPDVEIVFVRCELDSLAFRPHPAVHALRWSSPAEVDLSEVLAGDHEFLRRLGARVVSKTSRPTSGE